MSAGPTNRPRSEGLMGLASTLTRTSSGPGSGTGTLTSDSSSSPFLRIRDLSSRPAAVPLLIWLLRRMQGRAQTFYNMTKRCCEPQQNAAANVAPGAIRVDCRSAGTDLDDLCRGPHLPCRPKPGPLYRGLTKRRPEQASTASVGSAHRRMCMAKWSCWEGAEDPILVTQPSSEAGRTPEGGEHARRLSYGM